MIPKLLVVDDEPRYRQQIARLLERDGHDVETAIDGRSAVEISHRFVPDVLIVDWMLRDQINGLDLAKLLHARNPRMAIILITGYPSARLHEEIREREWQVRVLEKPFDLDALRDIVNWALSKKNLAQKPESPGQEEPKGQ